MAVSQLDRMTQQNAALVEESAAAAESLKDQSRQLDSVIARFRQGANNVVAQSHPVQGCTKEDRTQVPAHPAEIPTTPAPSRREHERSTP